MRQYPKIKKILYCTDLGRHTIPVFINALGQAANNQATITIVHVVEPMSETAKAVIETYMSSSDVEKVQKDGMEKVYNYMKKRINTFLETELGKSLDSEPIDEITVVAGKPSEEILQIAEKHDIDLVVMGKSSTRIRGSRVMGSTARRVARLSKIPVLIVPNR